MEPHRITVGRYAIQHGTHRVGLVLANDTYGDISVRWLDDGTEESISTDTVEKTLQNPPGEENTPTT